MFSKIPILILKNIVILPNTSLRLEINSKKDKEMLNYADEFSNNKIIAVPNYLDKNKNIDINELQNIGILVNIENKIILPNGDIRLDLIGEKRVEILNYAKDEKVLICELGNIIEVEIDNVSEEALYRKLVDKLITLINFAPNISNSIISEIENINELDIVTDIICGFLPSSIKKKIEYISIVDPIKRAKKLINDIDSELKILEIDQNIDDELSNNINNHEKEFILKEKIKLIKSELGEDDNREVLLLKEKINNLIECDIKTRLLKEIEKFEHLNIISPEYSMSKNYIELLLSVPLTKYSIETNDLNEAKRMLDKTHYGLDDVKERIIEFLALKIMSKNICSPIICLCGPPGVGKTTLAKSIAHATGRGFTKISVGGVNDEAEIMGHRKTYIGAMPGKIVNGLIRAKSMNPVFLIDEIDKMSKGIKGDPTSSLLEVLDKEQNKYFKDHYIDEEIDLSKVMFVLTANDIDSIPEALKDRLEIIELSSYTETEKLNLSKNYLIPNLIDEYNIDSENVVLDDETILFIIKNYTKEAGVRELNRLFSSILRKIIKKMVLTDDSDVTYKVNVKNIKSYLGNKKFYDSPLATTIGSSNAMSYTPYGGAVTSIECSMYEGNSEIVLTGSLGEVMKESATIAFDYIKTNKELFNIDIDFSKYTIHIHFVECGIKKDGPSAGIAITTALLSLFKNYKLNEKLSLTGEITLHGKVLPVGGIKEKIIGAYKTNIKKIIIPVLNENDLEDIDSEIINSIKFIKVNNYSEVYKELFEQ